MSLMGQAPTKAGKSARPEWSPHIWEGIGLGAWFRLLARHDFAVDVPHWYVAATVSFVSLAHSVLAGVQQLWLGRRIARTPIAEAPLFIIGHWRTGTTFLHELLIRDERHNYPTTYECMEPNHFLLTEKLISRWMSFLAPNHRPMDNMAAGFDRPQEDEFALCMLGQPSPYEIIAFPNQLPPVARHLDPAELASGQLAVWKKTFLRFLQQVTYRKPKRLILKSPPHSCRIKVLLELFPDARFVHIVRDPHVVFPSTVNLWKSLFRIHGLHRPTFAGLEEYVYATFLRLYEKLEEGKKLIPTGRFHELRYEDLVRDPLGEMRLLYDGLQLGDFEPVRPRLEEYLENLKGYETNRYEITPQLRAEIGKRWGEVIRRYGYAAG
jgi:hypothetical protein